MTDNYCISTIRYFIKRIQKTPLLLCYLVSGTIFSIVSQGLYGLVLTVLNLILLSIYVILIKKLTMKHESNTCSIKRPWFEMVIGLILFAIFTLATVSFFHLADVKILGSIVNKLLDLSYGRNSILNIIAVPNWLLDTAKNGVYCTFSETIPVFIVFIISGYGFKAMGFKSGNYKMIAVLVLITIILGLPFGVLTRKPILHVLFILIVHVFINALPEELFYRGYLLPRFEAVLSNPINALVVVSILFNLSHIPSYIYQGQTAGMAVAMSLSIVYPSGLIWGYLYQKTRSIVPGIIWHASNTLLGIIFLG